MFEWTPKRTCELIEIARRSPNRKAAAKEFAARYGINEKNVEAYLFQLTTHDPELDRELPKGSNVDKWTTEMSEELVAIVKASENRKAGCQKFADKYGITVGSAMGRLYLLIARNPELDRDLPKGESFRKPAKAVSIETALDEVLDAKGGPPLTETDIQAAAHRAGVSYHTALSKYGSMMAHGVEPPKPAVEAVESMAPEPPEPATEPVTEPVPGSSDNDGSQELAKLREIIDGLTLRLRASEAQLQEEIKSFESRERVYLDKIDTLTSARELDRQVFQRSREENDRLTQALEDAEKRINDLEHDAGTLRDMYTALYLEHVVLEELTRASLVVPSDLDTVIRTAAAETCVSEKAAEKAVGEAITSGLYRTWLNRVARAREESRLFREMSVAEASAPYEEVKKLRRQVDAVRKLNIALLNKVSKLQHPEETVN